MDEIRPVGPEHFISQGKVCCRKAAYEFVECGKLFQAEGVIPVDSSPRVGEIARQVLVVERRRAIDIERFLFAQEKRGGDDRRG